MSPEVSIVDCGPFCAVGFLRTIDKSEFPHSLDPERTFAATRNSSVTYGLNALLGSAAVELAFVVSVRLRGSVMPGSTSQRRAPLFLLDACGVHCVAP